MLTFQIAETLAFTRGFTLVSTKPHIMSGLVVFLPLQDTTAFSSMHKALQKNCESLKHYLVDGYLKCPISNGNQNFGHIREYGETELLTRYHIPI